VHPKARTDSPAAVQPAPAQVGVELVERTGRNPQNLFIQLGCSKTAEHKMLNYVRTQCIGKPFSNYAMVRSLVWPRETDNTSFFCAGMLANAENNQPCPAHSQSSPHTHTELVAAILKVGGLLDTNCNPGAATPEMLHRIYAPRAAVAANPCLLREINSQSLQAGPANGFIGNLTAAERIAEREALIAATSPYLNGGVGIPVQQALFQPARRRADSPPRGHFHSVNKDRLPIGASRGATACSSRCVTTGGIQLTMDSLKMGGGPRARPR